MCAETVHEYSTLLWATHGEETVPDLRDSQPTTLASCGRNSAKSSCSVKNTGAAVPRYVCEVKLRARSLFAQLSASGMQDEKSRLVARQSPSHHREISDRLRSHH